MDAPKFVVYHDKVRRQLRGQTSFALAIDDAGFMGDRTSITAEKLRGLGVSEDFLYGSDPAALAAHRFENLQPGELVDVKKGDFFTLFDGVSGGGRETGDVLYLATEDAQPDARSIAIVQAETWAIRVVHGMTMHYFVEAKPVDHAAQVYGRMYRRLNSPEFKMNEDGSATIVADQLTLNGRKIT